MTIDERLARHFGLYWHEAIDGVCSCGRDLEFVMSGTHATLNPDFTAQIEVDGEPQGLLVHHLRLSGELEGFLEWGFNQSFCTMSDENGMVWLLWRECFTDILLTPTLLRQAVDAYFDWKEAQ